MIPWKTVRIWLLAVLFIGVLCVLLKSILFPPSNKTAVTPFVFPTTVPLPQWQLLDSMPLKITNDPNFLASRRYRYQQSPILLTIDIHYIVNSSGDVKDFLQKHIFSQQAASSVAIRQKVGVGFHALFSYQGKAYLSSCMNPRGGSTVTFDQFRQNRNTYDVKPGRLILWLLGFQELRDFRCMWNMLSVPLEKTKPEEAYSILENAWFSWYSWWQPHFPRP
ncbi:cyanoexosortase A system-associated protein [Allocoleopsis sp.]|uniref:cyanoexosortase A system-associated protein n=1 Tax=Allocoleopsis sp. TaxID=3088169 RepID=UPI002FD46459